MNGFETRLAAVCDALNRHGAEYVIVGATANVSMDGRVDRVYLRPRR